MKKHLSRFMMMLAFALVLPLAVAGPDAHAAENDDSTVQEEAQVNKPAKVKKLRLMQESTKKVGLSWQAEKNASGYEVYMKNPGGTNYLFKKRVKDNSCTVRGVARGKWYAFRVRAYVRQNGNTITGEFSDSAAIKIKKSPGQVRQVKLDIDDTGSQVVLRWAKSMDADSYAVAYRLVNEKAWTILGQTRRTKYGVGSLKAGRVYEFVVYAQNGNVRADKPSKPVKVKPSAYLKKNRTRILASKVRTMGKKNGHYVYSKNYDYTNEIKEAYVNYKGLSSKTKYLVWANLYTQQATIFKGSKRKWKILYTFDIASGKYGSGTPRGTFKFFWHERMWPHPTFNTEWVTHFYKKASFHARPHYKKGGLKDKRIGAPISGGCIRCPDEYAIFIYKKVPLGTTVRVW